MTAILRKSIISHVQTTQGSWIGHALRCPPTYKQSTEWQLLRLAAEHIQNRIALERTLQHPQAAAAIVEDTIKTLRSVASDHILGFEESAKIDLHDANST